MDLQTIRATAESIARHAGEATMRYWGQPLEEITKANVYDIVTAGDKASEAVVVAALREAFPDHHIVSEEGGGTDLAARDADYFWYIDPVDGTTNYAHAIPHFAVSIAMTDRDRNPLVGVVFNPAIGELYSAARGCGAVLNGKPLKVTAVDRLEQSVLCTGFSTHKDRAVENLRAWEHFLMQVRDLRRFGSASLDLCYVGAGRLEGFWETHINPWDVLAGILVVQESGGMVTDFSGGTSLAYSGEQILATNGKLHDAMLEVLNGSDAER